MLAKNTGRRLAVAAVENKPRSQEAKGEITKFDFPEEKIRPQPGHKTQGVQGRAQMNQKESERKGVDGQQFRSRTNACFRSAREYQRKVKQQRRSQQARYNLRPVNFPVKGVQLSAEMERPENEGDQAKNVKVHGARGVPAADKNEQADEQIKQAYDAKVILGCERLFRGRCEQWRFEFLTTTGKFVAHLGPEPSTVQPPGDLRGSFDRSAIDRQEDVAGANPGASCGRIERNPTGLNSVVRVEPGYSVVHHLIAAALVEVNQGKNHRSQRG